MTSAPRRKADAALAASIFHFNEYSVPKCKQFLAERGVPVPVIQGICNHASITTTQRYIHAKGEARRSAIDLLGEAVRTRADERRRAKDEPPS